MIDKAGSHKLLVLLALLAIFLSVRQLFFLGANRNSVTMQEKMKVHLFSRDGNENMDDLTGGVSAVLCQVDFLAALSPFLQF